MPFQEDGRLTNVASDELASSGPHQHPKRPRLSPELGEEERSSAAGDDLRQQHRMDGDEDDGVGCVCENAGCPWSFGGESRPQQEGSSPSALAEASPGGSDARRHQPPLRQFFDGSLLSAKEYRDRPTGEVR